MAKWLFGFEGRKIQLGMSGSNSCRPSAVSVLQKSVQLRDVAICRERMPGQSIVKNHTFVGARNIPNDRLCHSSLRYGYFLEAHHKGVFASRSFCLDSLILVSHKDQQTALSTGVLNRFAHNCVDQSLQDDFTRHRLRDFDDGGEIQVLDRRANRARRTRHCLFFPDLRMHSSSCRTFPVAPQRR
jgi:hypothetical protein